MKKGEKGSASTLVIIMVFCFSTILFGSYLELMSLQKSQQKSNLKMQEIYGDDISKVDEIYEQIIKEKENINISYNPNGGEEYTSNNKMKVALSVDNVEDENVSIYYSWNESNIEEPTTWKKCKNEEKIEKNSENPGTYYLWSKVYKKNTSEVLKTEVSQKFVVKQKEIANENITYNWEKEYEWGTGREWDPKYYKIIIYITNHGKTQDNWEINFDVQPGIIIQNCNVWSASSVEANENTITMKCQSWNAQIREGNTLMVDFILAFDNAQDINIDNLKFNGEIIKKE